MNGENEHPNRLDVCKAKGAPSTQSQTSAPNQQIASTFGRPSSSAPALGQPSASSAFGGPFVSPFGQPSAPTATPTFGQPSAPTFGQPSQSSAFGQASTTSFGQPSLTFGKASIPAPTFGQASVPGPFGTPQPQQQPNAFGKPSGPDFIQQPSAANKNSFGQPSAPSQTSAFGRPSTSNASPAFGQPAVSGTASGFPQSSTVPVNAFAQPTAPSTTATFSQPSTAAPNPFGQRKPSFANQPVPSFGQPFGHSNTAKTSTGPAADRTGARVPGGQGAYGGQTQKDSQDKITSWNGTPVRYFDDEPCYKGNDGNWRRIWFPDGPPAFTKTVDLPDEAYDEATKENYRHLKQTGNFKDGIMPALPPKREWCSWNF